MSEPHRGVVQEEKLRDSSYGRHHESLYKVLSQAMLSNFFLSQVFKSLGLTMNLCTKLRGDTSGICCQRKSQREDQQSRALSSGEHERA